MSRSFTRPDFTTQDAATYKAALDDGVDACAIDNETPASASATGVAGTIVWDASYVYVCVATNTWKRAAIATW